MKSFQSNNFYCLNCGGMIPLMRSKGNQKEKFHRKKIYCPFCKKIVNHIECKTNEDILEFKENFNKGIYTQEALDSILVVDETNIFKFEQDRRKEVSKN